jgi:type III pantothenate kinase
MDINVLVINAGNSRLAVGSFVAGELAHVDRVDISQHARWPGAISEAWKRVADQSGAVVAAATVNPPLIEPIEHAVMQATDQPVQWVGRQIDLPIKVLTDDPSQTGIDRVLNVAAAYEQMEKACVVVDAGTAVTVNCCNDKGDFLGGAIAPGVSLMLDALHEHTAKLPRVVLAAPKEAFGKSTEEAIRHGIYHGVRGMVKELVEQYATELGSWPDIIATGGDAKILFDNWELVHAISPDLILYGIALAYAEHQIKHGT